MKGIDMIQPMPFTKSNRMSDLDFTDELAAMARRCQGLEIAVAWICSEQNKVQMGVNQLATDVAEAMDRLAESFESERQKRMETGEKLQERTVEAIQAAIAENGGGESIAENGGGAGVKLRKKGKRK